MPMQRYMFPEHLDKSVTRMFGMDYEMYPKQWTQLFDQESIDGAYDTEMLMAGTGPAPLYGEGELVPEDQFSEGWKVSVTVVKIGMRLGITKEMVDDNRHESLLARYVPSVSDSMNETAEILHISVLNNAYSTDYPGGDGQPLLSNAHPLIRGGTFSNVLATSAQMSEEAFEDMWKLIRRTKADSGLLAQLRIMNTYCHPDNVFEYRRIFGGSERPGTTDRDINALKQLGYFKPDPILLDRLADTDKWFVKTNIRRGFIHKRRQAVQKWNFEDEGRRIKWFCFDERYGYQFIDPRCCFGPAQ